MVDSSKHLQASLFSQNFLGTGNICLYVVLLKIDAKIKLNEINICHPWYFYML
jgi:hypothetical protein